MRSARNFWTRPGRDQNRPFALAWAITLIVSGGFVPRAQAASAISFNEQIRPLLNEHCIKCHGGVKEAGDLDLLFRDAALHGGKSGLPAIVPGKPEASEMIARLTTTNEDDRMPKKADPLKPEQIELLKQWISSGARWEEHWAYVPPQGTGQSIDDIVQRRLAKEHLSLSPEADRWTLARRSAFDLTGLPPSPEAVAAFAKDRAPDAYERWIDQLLASPAYGERWASVWLDVARYADSKGYEKDGFRDVWRYRDWVIDAYNSDKPYDQFLIEQLAGDLLPDPTPDQIIATAFHRNTPSNDEGGTDDEEFRTYAVIDRLNTTFDAIQGTTIGCVQCHGHPYDPFVHREYYQLLAFFDNTADADRDDEAPTRRFYARADVAPATLLEQKIAATERQLDGELQRVENRQTFAAWLRAMRQPADSIPLHDLNVASTEGKYAVQPEGRILLTGATPTNTTITVEGAPAPGNYQAITLTAVPDETLPQKGPGGADNGNFVLTRLRATLFPAGSATGTQLEFTNARATFAQPEWPAAATLQRGRDGKVGSEGGWAILGGVGEPQTATFVLAAPIEVASGAKLRVTLECENAKWPKHVLGSFQLATSHAPATERFAALPEKVRKILDKDTATWSADERESAERQCFQNLNTNLTALYSSLDENRAALAALPSCKLPIMVELTGTKARTTRVFHRGNWLDKDEPVAPITPKILNAWHDDYPRNRLGLAEWLTNGENPLTARVQVNRVWEELFGLGLVETLEDFGSQGDKPVYQELLDELAVRFQTTLKWSQKALLREIVLSRVYRQSAKATAAQIERDPANRLLARGPRFRLTSEELRDQALVVSGTLSRKMFGPPVMPYQPPGMWQTPYDGHDWITATNANGYRRAIYTFIRRSATYPSFVTFDAPNREFCTVRRIRSNTPLQSLDALNNPVFFEAAQGLARRMTAEGGADLPAQLQRGMLLATLRPPQPDEIAVLEKLYQRSNGNLALVANAILNLDEVLNKN